MLIVHRSLFIVVHLMDFFSIRLKCDSGQNAG